MKLIVTGLWMVAYNNCCRLQGGERGGFVSTFNFHRKGGREEKRGEKGNRQTVTERYKLEQSCYGGYARLFALMIKSKLQYLAGLSEKYLGSPLCRD